jgi:SNF2 family DNA or RNA helicase
MEPDQEKVYKDLEDKMLAELPSKGILAVSDVLTRLIRLRQCLITPKLLDPKLSWGAGFEQIGELMEDTDDHHFAVFTPFRAPLPILKDYLVSRGTQPDNIILLHGGLSVEELGIRLAHFREERGVALVTIKFAESFDLIPASWGVFLGVEWTPDENWQAEDRLHRGNIERAVNIYYIQHKGTIDTTLMLPTLDEKATLARRTTLNADLLRQAIQQRRLYDG